MYAVILAGGSGVPLRPLGAAEEPVAFREMPDGRTLLQRMAERLEPLVDPVDIVVVANRRHGQLVREQVRDARIVPQPTDRGTAAALALAIVAVDRPESETVVVLSADHDLERDDELRDAITTVDERLVDGAARSESPIIVFATVPTGPDREMTWLQPDANSGQRVGRLRAYRTDWVEARPEATRARQMYESGTTYWSAGLYVANRDVIADAIERYTPLFTLLRSAYRSELALSAAYDRLQPVSIEEGILVGAARDDRLLTVPLDVGWHVPTAAEREMSTANRRPR